MQKFGEQPLVSRAERYERTEARKDTRAGSYQQQLHTKAGEVTLKVPKLRTLPFETAIIERYRRRESSVEEALVEMYLAGVSVRRLEDITEALWARASAQARYPDKLTHAWISFRGAGQRSFELSFKTSRTLRCSSSGVNGFATKFAGALTASALQFLYRNNPT